MLKRTVIPKGEEINLIGTHNGENFHRKFKIIDLVGEGASSQVYNAIYKDSLNIEHNVILKELNPAGLGLGRDGYNVLVIPPESRGRFEAYKKKFIDGYLAQTKFQEIPNSRNTTSNARELYKGNETVYIEMNLDDGECYSRVKNETLKDILEIALAITKAVAVYHFNSHVHLDLADKNVYKIKGTNNVKLFDYDSVVTIADAQSGKIRLSYTKGWAAPELLRESGYSSICETTDFFSIGAIVFKRIFGKHPETEHMESNSIYDFSENKLFEKVSPQIKESLTVFFRKTLNTNPRNRFTTDKIMQSLNELITLSGTVKYFLADQQIHALEYFDGRNEQLKEIRENFKQKQSSVTILAGTGGIGKTELTKAYARAERNSYHTIQLTTYSVSLESVISNLSFVNYEVFEKEIYEEKLKRKKDTLIKCDENVLIIIDNFNVDVVIDKNNDSAEIQEFKKKEYETLTWLKSLHCHILITSRYISENSIKIGYINAQTLKNIFFNVFKITSKELNCTPDMDFINEQLLDEVITDIVKGHTLTVILTAKLAAFCAASKKKQFLDIVEALRNAGLRSIPMSIPYEKHGADMEEITTVYEHIHALFKLSEITEEEKKILVNLCLLPPIRISLFERLIGYKDQWNDMAEIKRLVKSSWLQRENDYISLHPIVAEIISYDCPPPKWGAGNCSTLLNNISRAVESLVKGNGLGIWLESTFESESEYADIGASALKVLTKLEFENTENMGGNPKLEFFRRGELGRIVHLTANIGFIYNYLGKPEKCVDCILRIMKYEPLLLTLNDTIQLYSTISNAYSTLEKHSEAIDAACKGLEMGLNPPSALKPENLQPQGKRNQPPKYSVLAKAYTAVSKAYYESVGKSFHPIISKQNDYTDMSMKETLNISLENINAALKIFTLEPIVPLDLAQAYGHLGNIYSGFKNPQTASEYLMKALKLYEENSIFPPKLYFDIADNLFTAGNNSDSLQYLEKAIAMFEDNKLFPPDNLNLALSYLCMGQVHRRLKNDDDAMEFLRKALKIFEKSLPKNHPKILLTQNLINIILSKNDTTKEKQNKVVVTASARKNSESGKYDITVTASGGSGSGKYAIGVGQLINDIAYMIPVNTKNDPLYFHKFTGAVPGSTFYFGAFKQGDNHYHDSPADVVQFTVPLREKQFQVPITISLSHKRQKRNGNYEVTVKIGGGSGRGRFAFYMNEDRIVSLRQVPIYSKRNYHKFKNIAPGSTWRFSVRKNGDDNFHDCFSVAELFTAPKESQEPVTIETKYERQEDGNFMITIFAIKGSGSGKYAIGYGTSANRNEMKFILPVDEERNPLDFHKFTGITPGSVFYFAAFKQGDDRFIDSAVSVTQFIAPIETVQEPILP